MVNQHLKLNPQHLSVDVWYYEEKKGLTIVHRINEKGVYVRTDQFTISWPRIRSALKRKDLV